MPVARNKLAQLVDSLNAGAQSDGARITYEGTVPFGVASDTVGAAGNGAPVFLLPNDAWKSSATAEAVFFVDDAGGVKSASSTRKLPAASSVSGPALAIPAMPSVPRHAAAAATTASFFKRTPCLEGFTSEDPTTAAKPLLVGPYPTLWRLRG